MSLINFHHQRTSTSFDCLSALHLFRRRMWQLARSLIYKQKTLPITTCVPLFACSIISCKSLPTGHLIVRQSYALHTRYLHRTIDRRSASLIAHGCCCCLVGAWSVYIQHLFNATVTADYRSVGYYTCCIHNIQLPREAISYVRRLGHKKLKGTHPATKPLPCRCQSNLVTKL